MADVEHGNVQVGLQAVQVGQDFGLAFGVQGGQGFVHQQHLRAGGQGAGNGHALAFAAGQGGRLAAQQLCDAQQLQQLFQRDTLAGHGGAAQAVMDVVVHAQVREQAGLLEHIAQAAPVRGQPAAAGIVLPDMAVDAHLALGTFQSGDAAQAGGLAAARGAEQRGNALAGQLQIDVEHKVGALQLQAGGDHTVIHGAGQGYRGELWRCARGCSQCSSTSTTKAKTTMPPASQWAWAYSMASTWS